MIRHPANPFLKRIDEREAVHAPAGEYVRAYNGRMNLPEKWLEGLSRPALRDWTVNLSHKTPSDDQLVLRWLPFDRKNPRASFIVERRQGDGQVEVSGVLLAGLCLAADPNAKEVWLRARRLRVVFHVARHRDSGGFQVRFTGMSRSTEEAPPPELLGNVFVDTGPVRKGGKKKVYAEAFPQDPASLGGLANMRAWRPCELSADLAPAQQEVSLGRLPQQPGNRVALSSPVLEVLNSDLVTGDAPRGEPKTVAVHKVGAKWHVTETKARTNDFAAVSAYYHGLSFFERLESYGLTPAQYFRCAEPTVYVQYRGVLHGSDGRVRNAEVVWDAKTPPRLEEGIPGRIIVRFGLADLRISPLRYPLGMSTDVRWNWHEYGHVMLMASVGEREFRFAHSAGDAMAAILSDPDSQLAGGAAWRGLTFPWVTLGRRHDRWPADGWAWDGILDQRDHGYWKEQILSSTLFRFYQVLGGDSADPDSRKAAAHYTAFLIMQAIGLLGAAALVAAGTPDQFVSALMDADIGTGTFLAPDIPPEAFATAPPRVGGTVYKVVRWAFEQQGLYTKQAKWPAVGPGEPPLVDVYICSDLNGGYAARPATYDIVVGGTVQGQANNVTVSVGNRGENNAQNVRVTLWAARANAGVPRWKKPGAWKEQSHQVINIAARNPGTPVPLQWTPWTGGPYVLLAEVTCDEDRSNIRDETALPCALDGAPMAHLVGGDNNLGLKPVTAS